MTTTILRFCAAARAFFAVLVTGLVLTAPTAQAALVYALTDENDLLSFDSASPEDLLGNANITGLVGSNSEDLIGIDIRPANNRLYSVSDEGNIYTINPANGVATFIAALNNGAGGPVALAGSRFGFDFNPVPDRLRIVSDLDQNLRVNPTTGATTVDTPLQYGAGPGFGVNPNVTAAAYTNSFSPAPATTTLYAIDVRAANDRLVIISPPNNGTLQIVGPLGVNVGSLNGFDILTTGTVHEGFAALQPVSMGVHQFFSINLGTGQATLLGTIGGGELIDGIAVVGSVIPEPATLGLLGMGMIGCVIARRRTR